MTAEYTPQQSVPYERRLEVADVLRTVIGDGLRGESFFNTTLRPNLLPEDIPRNLPDNVTWLGEKAKMSISRCSDAIGDLLHELIAIDAMTMDDAGVCADSLSLNCFYDTAVYAFPPGGRGQRTAKTVLLENAAIVPLFTVTPLHEASGVKLAPIVPIPAPKHGTKPAPDMVTPATVYDMQTVSPDALVLQFKQRESA